MARMFTWMYAIMSHISPMWLTRRHVPMLRCLLLAVRLPRLRRGVLRILTPRMMLTAVTAILRPMVLRKSSTMNLEMNGYAVKRVLSNA